MLNTILPFPPRLKRGPHRSSVTEMQQKNFVEPFVYYASQRANIPGVQEWLTANNDRVTAFLAWSKAYNWPQP